MIRVYKFQDADIDKINPKDFYLRDPTFKGRLLGIAHSEASVLYSFIDEQHEVVAIVGGWVLYPGVAELCSVTSSLVYKYKKDFIKFMKQIIDTLQKKLNLFRMQFAVPLEVRALDKYALALGFQEEGLMRQYGPDGSDYKLYSRIW